MSCIAMLPSNSIQRGVDSNDESSHTEQGRRAALAQALSSGLIRPAGPPLSNAGLLESIIVAQEQQRRRALLLAAATRAPMGVQSMLSSNDAVARLAAERQRAFLGLGGSGIFGGRAGFLGGFVGPIGGLGSLRGLGALSSGINMGVPLSAIPQGTGATTSSARDFLSTAREPSRLPAWEAPVVEPLRPTSPTSFLHSVRRQRGTRPADFVGDSVILDAMERSGRKGRTGTFPQKLYKALTELEKEGRTNIAAWLPNGNAFVIYNPKAFDDDVMKKYFRMSHFSSFQRQLNLYEFGRITEGPDKGAYFHELFHRGRPILASQIRRNKIKGESNATGVKTDNKSSPSLLSSRAKVEFGAISSFLKSKGGAGTSAGPVNAPSVERTASVGSKGSSDGEEESTSSS